MKKLLYLAVFAILSLILSRQTFAQNVGVGTLNPNHKLQVQDTGANRIIAFFGNTGGGYGEIDITNGLDTVDLGVLEGSAGFVGTKDARDFMIRTGGLPRIFLRHITSNVGIGTFFPHPGASLDITSTTKGFLPPRMTDAQRDQIVFPVKGLMVFVTTDSSFYFYDGAWRRLTPANEVWSLKGNSGTGINDFIGTTENNSLRFRIGNVKRMELDSTGRLQLFDDVYQNLFIGASAGIHNQSANPNEGHQNQFTGHFAGFYNTTGSFNHFNGFCSGLFNTTGMRNHFAGYLAGYTNDTGNHNHFDGYLAGHNSKADDNYFSGLLSGINCIRGSQNTLVGNHTNVGYDSLTNAGAIGFMAKVSASNSFVIGGTGSYAVNVGIGTINPIRTLHVVDSGSNRIISTFGSTGGFGEINVTNNTNSVDFGVSGNGGYIGTKDTSNFRIRTGAITRMFFHHNTGNVGIGTTTPGEKLDVNGNITLSGNIINEGFLPATLQSGWTNFGQDYATATYYKDKEGRVHLRGLVKGGPSASDLIFTLPPGYRPSANERLVFAVLSNSILGRVDIDPDGSVIVVFGDINSWVSLAGISFRASQ